MRSLVIVAALLLATVPALAEEAPEHTPTVAAVRCPHGVKPTVCTRCNPKLEAVYKAKGDWCAEHARPESQCAECHPELAEQGVK